MRAMILLAGLFLTPVAVKKRREENARVSLTPEHEIGDSQSFFETFEIARRPIGRDHDLPAGIFSPHLPPTGLKPWPRPVIF